jgi:hypothetical protein
VVKERDSQPLSGHIQIDDVYWGGEHLGGKRGRGASGKTPFVAAVQTNEEGRPIAMRMTKLKGFRKEELARWSQRHLSAGSHVVSDGLYCFRADKKSGCLHEAIVTGGGSACVAIEAFTWVNTMIGNIKNSMHGSYHAISERQVCLIDDPLPLIAQMDQSQDILSHTELNILDVMMGREGPVCAGSRHPGSSYECLLHALRCSVKLF